ncbi:MAG: hypothetical protein IPH05_08810 [Flavobacteriales bacterium]|nr:hypothetical protein [Flavobacteriales bacterium]
MNKANDRGTDWYSKKCVEYIKSGVWSSKLMAAGFAIGKDTAVNRARDHYGFPFKEWNKKAIERHQKVMLEPRL